MHLAHDDHGILSDETHMTAVRRDDRYDGLVQMIQQIDEKHEAAHARLRIDTDKNEEHLTKGLNSLREGYLSNEARIKALENAPVDLGKVMFAPRVVMMIITLIVTIVGAFWASTYGLRSDVRDILTRMEAKNNADENARKIMEMRIDMLSSAVNETKKAQQLKQYDVQDLKDLLLQGRTKVQK